MCVFIPIFLPFQTYNELFCEMMTEDQVLAMVAKSQEFDQIKVLFGHCVQRHIERA